MDSLSIHENLGYVDIFFLLYLFTTTSPSPSSSMNSVF